MDKKLLYPEAVIVQKYKELKNQTGKPSINQLKAFIDQYFADDPLEAWEPLDFKPIPSVVNNIQDDAFRKWVLNLNQIWKDLAQRVPDDVRQNPDRHSMLYLPNGFIKVKSVFST